MGSKKQSKAVKVVAGKSTKKPSVNGQIGGTLSVNGGTNPIPAVRADAADEIGGVQSVNGGTNPIPAVKKAKSATAGT